MSAVTIPEFDSRASELVISSLTKLYRSLGGVRPPGLIQAMLLRQESGSAMLLVQWRSRNDLHDFLSSQQGWALAGQFAELTQRNDLQFSDYFVTWQTDLPEPHEPSFGGCGGKIGSRP